MILVPRKEFSCDGNPRETREPEKFGRIDVGDIHITSDGRVKLMFSGLEIRGRYFCGFRAGFLGLEMLPCMDGFYWER